MGRTSGNWLGLRGCLLNITGTVDNKLKSLKLARPFRGTNQSENFFYSFTVNTNGERAILMSLLTYVQEEDTVFE